MSRNSLLIKPVLPEENLAVIQSCKMFGSSAIKTGKMEKGIISLYKELTLVVKKPLAGM